MKLKLRLASILIFLLFLLTEVCLASPRKVTIRWLSVKNASQYDIQISSKAEMIPTLHQKKSKDTSLSLLLSPGTYFFRVRAIRSSGLPGPWTDVEGFTVNENPPLLKEPQDKRGFRKPLPPAGVTFRWSRGRSGTKHFIEIKDKSGTVLDREVDEDSLVWAPPRPGKYRWRVGFESASRKEWSSWRRFFVSKKALKGVSRIATLEAEWWKERDVPAGVMIIARGAQSITSYESTDTSSGSSTTSSGAALSGAGSLELRWWAGKAKNALGMFSGSFNAELLRQTVLSQTFNLPRAYTRLFYTMGTPQWRAGPFIHAHYGQGVIFIVKNNTTASSATVTRYGGGAGGVAVYKPTPTLGLSLLGMLRYDMGGSSSFTGNIDPTLGWEFGFGVVFDLTTWLQLEGRTRAQRETYEWTPSGASSKSSMINTFIIFDFGVGLKF